MASIYRAKGLEDFVSFFTSLPNLHNVRINVLSESRFGGSSRVEQETDPFLEFAVSGIRKLMLWTEINERLQGNDGYDRVVARKLEDKVFVWTKFQSFKLSTDEDDMMDYGEWLTSDEKSKHEVIVEAVEDGDNS